MSPKSQAPTSKAKPSPAESAVAADNRRRAREAAKAAKIAETSQSVSSSEASKPRESAILHKIGDVFPEQSADAIAAAVAAWWDTAGPLPLPRALPACPVCHAPYGFPRAWSVYRLPTPGKVAHAHRHPWRCDVSMKCHTCSHVWAHGLAITEAQAAQYGANPRALAAVAYTWRQARDRLAGYLKG